jgi:hypothetical protein
MVWGCGRYSIQARAGGSGLESSLWTSETSLACRAGTGTKGSAGLVASVGLELGSVSGGMSYGRGELSAGTGRNVMSSGSRSVSVSGGGFGSSRYAVA